MKDYTEKLIETKTLENGVKLSLFNLCKPIAADRWYVKILCRMELDVPEQWSAGSGFDQADQAAFSTHYNGVLVHEFTKERNFVDENVKDEVVSAIIGQIHDNSLAYVANPVFAANLLQQKVDQFIQEQNVRREMGMVHDDEEEDDGPADFSACFRD